MLNHTKVSSGLFSNCCIEEKLKLDTGDQKPFGHTWKYLF